MRLRTFLVVAAATLQLLTTDAALGETAPPRSDLKTATGSGVQYYLSLPKAWTPKSTWPILVTIDGAGHNFPANFQSFINARGDRPFIIVTPCVTSNGNDPAELKAVLGIVQEVQKSSGGQPKFFITGCSAGGHLTWQCILMHPELLAGAAPTAANFRSRGIGEISKAPERIRLTVHAFQGDKDGIKPALDAQWADAVKLARENGCENLTRTEVPGAGHQPFPNQVVNFFASLLPK